MKTYAWNSAKNDLPEKERGISFEKIVLNIQLGNEVDIYDHPNPERYPNQKISVVLVFGKIGFIAILISAIVSTVTCLNGGLFGVTSITFTLAEYGQLPSRFMREIYESNKFDKSSTEHYIP